MVLSCCGDWLPSGIAPAYGKKSLRWSGGVFFVSAAARGFYYSVYDNGQGFSLSCGRVVNPCKDREHGEKEDEYPAVVVRLVSFHFFLPPVLRLIIGWKMVFVKSSGTSAITWEHIV